MVFNHYFENEAISRLQQEQRYSQYSSSQVYFIHTYNDDTDEDIVIDQEYDTAYDENNEMYETSIIEEYDSDDENVYFTTGNLFYDTIQYIYTDEFYQQLAKEPNVDTLAQKETDRILSYCRVTYSPTYRGGGFSLKYSNLHSINELTPCVPRL